MNAVSLENTTLMVEAFQGTVTIHDFSLQQPTEPARRASRPGAEMVTRSVSEGC